MSKKDIKSDYFKTPDLPLATTISIWFPIEFIDRSDPQKVLFIFKSNFKLQNLIEKYWRGELRVDPKEYSHSLKEIKTRIYSENIQEEGGEI